MHKYMLDDCTQGLHINDMPLLGDTGAEGVDVCEVGVDRQSNGCPDKDTSGFAPLCLRFVVAARPQLPQLICVCTGDLVKSVEPYGWLFTPSRYCLAHSALVGNKARNCWQIASDARRSRVEATIIVENILSRPISSGS